MESPPRISLLMPDAHAGGAERVMLSLAGDFAGRGFAVDLVLVRATGQLLAEIPDGVRVWPLLGPQGVGGLSMGLAAIPALFSYLRRERPAAMLSTLTGTNLLAVVARGLAGSDARLILREASAVRNVRSRLRRLLMQWLYPKADAIVAVSRGVANDLAGLGLPASLLKVITNPVDRRRLQRLAALDLEIEAFSPDDGPWVLSVGRLVEPKDYPTLLRAFAKVRSTRKARLLILGEGPLRGELESLARSLRVELDVFMPGHVANPFPAYRHAAVFALSSRWEGFPNALSDAVALGVPAVATDCDHGPREVLDHGRLGTLVPVGDSDALAESIAALLPGSNGQALDAGAPACEDRPDAQIDAVELQYLVELLGPQPMKGPAP